MEDSFFCCNLHEPLEGSIARIKSMEDRGSPYHMPLSCLMGFLGVPFRRSLDEEDVRAMLSHSLHFRPKPNLCSTSKTYAKDTKSIFQFNEESLDLFPVKFSY
jgi:hypothetical protein